MRIEDATPWVPNFECYVPPTPQEIAATVFHRLRTILPDATPEPSFSPIQKAVSGKLLYSRDWDSGDDVFFSYGKEYTGCVIRNRERNGSRTIYGAIQHNQPSDRTPSGWEFKGEYILFRSFNVVDRGFHIDWKPGTLKKYPWRIHIAGQTVIDIPEHLALWSEALVLPTQDPNGNRRYVWEGMSKGVVLREHPRTRDEYVEEIIEAGRVYIGPDIFDIL